MNALHFTIICTLLLAGLSRGQPLSTDSAASERRFSLFDYRDVVSAGVSLSWLYYAEETDVAEVARNFENAYGYAPQRITGAPKSTEYGVIEGIHLAATLFNWQNKLIVRPKGGLLVGFGNTYDGSTQAQPVLNASGDSAIGFEFYPVKFQKTNVFFFAGCDAGYALPYGALPCFIYTGLDFKLWYRNLISNQYVLYASGGSNWETYYWLSVPLGVMLSHPVNGRVVVGMDASVNFMVYGAMQVGMDAGASSVSYPAVVLGNRPSARIELFVEKKRDNRPGLKFAPYFLYYGFARSNEAAASDGETFFEPSSNSFLFGATLSWEFFGKRIK
jgi:hypothetical protein